MTIRHLLFVLVLSSVGFWRVLGLWHNTPHFAVESSVRLRFEVEDVFVGRRFQQLVYFQDLAIPIPVGQVVAVGDWIEVKGIVKKPVFGKGLQLVPDQMVVTSGTSVLAFVRKETIRRFGKWLPAGEAGLAAGIVIGGSDLFLRQSKLAFSGSGMTHIIAASGYNVTVVAGALSVVLLPVFGRRKMIPFVILMLQMYMVLAGMGPPILRAGLMGIVGYVGLVTGRKPIAVWVLLLVSLVMIIVWPEMVSDVSFWLSVLATWALVASGTSIARLFVTDLKTTVAVTVWTLPVVWYVFGQMSLLGLVANPLVLPVIPLLMLIEGIAALVGWVWQPLGMVVSWIGWPLLRYVTFVAEAMTQIPGQFQLPETSLVGVFGIYLVMFGLYLGRIVMRPYIRI